VGGGANPAAAQRLAISYNACLQCAGVVSDKEASELHALAKEIRDATVAWLERKHPGLAPTPTLP